MSERHIKFTGFAVSKTPLVINHRSTLISDSKSSASTRNMSLSTSVLSLDAPSQKPDFESNILDLYSQFKLLDEQAAKLRNFIS